MDFKALSIECRALLVEFRTFLMDFGAVLLLGGKLRVHESHHMSHVT